MYNNSPRETLQYVYNILVLVHTRYIILWQHQTYSYIHTLYSMYMLNSLICNIIIILNIHYYWVYYYMYCTCTRYQAFHMYIHCMYIVYTSIHSRVYKCWKRYRQSNTSSALPSHKRVWSKYLMRQFEPFYNQQGSARRRNQSVPFCERHFAFST